MHSNGNVASRMQADGVLEQVGERRRWRWVRAFDNLLEMPIPPFAVLQVAPNLEVRARPELLDTCVERFTRLVQPTFEQVCGSGCAVERRLDDTACPQGLYFRRQQHAPFAAPTV